MGRIRHALNRVLDPLASIPWHLRHPTCRRCPECRLTWEDPASFAMQGGVCHDCFGHHVVADWEAH